MEIRAACEAEADALTVIAFAAKRHWGYPETWIQQWTDTLTITCDYVRANPTFVAVERGEIAGFCALCPVVDGLQLDHLWVRPTAMGRSIGRALFQHAEEAARSAGATRLMIEGDPHAEGFYQRMGARICGRRAAPMEGRERFLPLLEKRLAPVQSAATASG